MILRLLVNKKEMRDKAIKHEAGWQFVGEWKISEVSVSSIM